MIEQVKIYKIISDNLSTLRDKFVKLGRRAKKLNLPEPTFTEVNVERKEKKCPHSGKIERVYLLHHIVVDPGCTLIQVSGWTFVATIQITEEGNIIRNVGQENIPPEYRAINNKCEHCNTIRNRKDVYLLRHEDGTYKVVGRNCLSDFFGHDALVFAERAQYLADINSLSESMEDALGFGSGGPNYFPLENYLPYVAESIKLDGWLSRSKARQLDMPNMATCEVAIKHMNHENTLKLFTPIIPSIESIDLANKAIQWASEIEGEDISDYLHNIRVIARRMVYEIRDMGLAASIVSAYQRHLTNLRWKDLQSKRAEIASHVGNVGDRIRVNVTVEKVVQCYSVYGVSHLHIMSDDIGNVYVWFSSFGAYTTGNQILLKGTIKKHDVREGVKQNILSRCEEVKLKTYFAIVNDRKYTLQAEKDTEARKLLREKLCVNKLPKDVCIIEDMLEPYNDEI